jgi:predicted RNase H-like HicB family nuclease
MFNKIYRLFYPAKSIKQLKNDYNIPSSFNAHIRFTKDGYLILTCDELPGFITEGKDGKKLLENFNDAVLTYYDIPKKEGDIVHNQLDIDGYGTFTLHNTKKAKQLA